MSLFSLLPQPQQGSVWHRWHEGGGENGRRGGWGGTGTERDPTGPEDSLCVRHRGWHALSITTEEEHTSGWEAPTSWHTDLPTCPLPPPPHGGGEELHAQHSLFLLFLSHRLSGLAGSFQELDTMTSPSQGRTPSA